MKTSDIYFVRSLTAFGVLIMFLMFCYDCNDTSIGCYNQISYCGIAEVFFLVLAILMYFLSWKTRKDVMK